MAMAEPERDSTSLALIQDYLRRRAARVENFEGMTEAERAAEAERRRERARRLAQRARERELEAAILDFDPKQGGTYYNRLYFVDFTTFDLDEESPLGPMRYTDRVSKPGGRQYKPCEAINIFSVKIASSDVGFPLHVYGTVIARDSIDRKCLYLFRRDRDHCQLINSEDESLILTGPKRGLALIDDDYVEVDLKIRDPQGQDRELSKGILTIRGMAGRSLKKCEVETESLATRLSTVDVMYAVVKLAVEATIAIEVLQGEFYGKITAHTTSISNPLVLNDSELTGVMTAYGNKYIHLMRSVVSVYVMDMLIIVAKTVDGKYERTIKFTPMLNGWDEDKITVGASKMRVKVTWSIMDY
ncbi:hypothetical protein ACP70R_028466 [Stipagrostis hirtigluma subsp. patula]